MFDVFYYGQKPDLFPHEQPAHSLEEATKLSRTEFFWYIHGENDYSEFDFTWIPPPWEKQFRHVWYDENDAGRLTYFVNIRGTVPYVDYYHHDEIIRLRIDFSRWEIPDDIDKESFDFRWKPAPWEPPYIYQFGTQWQKTGGPKYKSPGATEVKYLESPRAKKLPNDANWILTDLVDLEKFDFSWHPDDTEPPYVYIFGSKHIAAELREVARYVVSGATGTKYVDNPRIHLKIDKSKWDIPDDIDRDSFDFTWIPDSGELPFIFQFPSQWRRTGGPRYIADGATSIKYMNSPVAKRKQIFDNWEIPDDIDRDSFDFSWQPDEYELPFIFQFPSQWRRTGGPRYIAPGATEIKYLDFFVAKRKQIFDNWEIPDDIDRDGFDFSWQPDEHDPPLIYQFGTQWQKTGGPRYIVPGATEIKYIDNGLRAKHISTHTHWKIPDDIDQDSFDFSWHPDDTEPPFIYQFPSQWRKTGGPTYIVPGATMVKYMSEPIAKRKQIFDNWEIPDDIDRDSFDFSWQPDEHELPFIFQFPSQWRRTGGPRYVAPGASTIKYLDKPVAKRKQIFDNWVIPSEIDITSFDFSWQPDEYDLPYIYQFGTQWQKTGGPQFIPHGVQEIKFISSQVAKRNPVFDNWEIPENVDETSFDFSWHPDETESPFIYQFGTQWQKTGGPRYIVPGATSIKYISDLRIKHKANFDNWEIPDDIDRDSFDFSWHPDDTEPAFIYQFPNQWRIDGGPKYIVPGATETRVINVLTAKRKQIFDNWEIPDDIDRDSFDFSWQPGDYELPFIFQFPSQWRRTGGPRYVADGGTDMKYLDSPIAKRKQIFDNWEIPDDIDKESFDFSWQPDEHEPPFIYQFGTQWQKTGGPTFYVHGATEVKYLDILKAKRIRGERNRWVVKEYAELDDSDYSWHPDATEIPYIYIFGSEIASPEILEMARYVVPNAKEIKYQTDLKIKFIEDQTHWEWDESIDENSINFRWRPHPFEPPLIYQFGTQWQKTGGPRYVVPGATEIKLCSDFISRKLPNKKYWHLDPAVDYSSFDFSWHPDDSQKKYKHIFGTQWQHTSQTSYYEGNEDNPPINYVEDVRVTSGSSYLPRYYIDTTLDELIKQHPTERFWALSKTMNYEKFDFSWHPDLSQFDYVHVFGSEWQKDGQTYLVNGPSWHAGNKSLNYVEAVKAQAIVNYDIFFVDKLNAKSAERFKQLKEKYPTIQKTRLINGLLETIKRCLVKASTDKVWIITSDIVYSNFNFSWHPSSWQHNMLHVFGSQKQKWSETLLINKSEFNRNIRWCKSLQEFPNLNFVSDQFIDIPEDLYDKFFIARTEKETGTYRKLKNKFNNVRYLDGSKDVFAAYQKAAAEAKTEMFWVVDSDAEIDNEFDFRYPVPAWDREYVHVCRQDNTFAGVYLLPKKREITKKETRYRFFRNSKTIDINASHYRPWDIFFISYYESNAEANWTKLKKRFPTAMRINGIKGIYNAHRVAADKAGTKMFYVVDGDAEIVDTFDFQFQVPKWDQDGVYVWHSRNPINDLEYGYGGVKLLPKHAVLNLNFTGADMTTSISKKFNIVPEVSNITTFNTDPYSTWKSAFRECVKLASGLIHRQDDKESAERLKTWCFKGEDRQFGEWAIIGARDGKAFGSDPNNDLTLINNFEWLKEFYDKKYNS